MKDDTLLNEALAYGQVYADMYNALAPALPAFCEGVEQIMTETQPARKVLVDLVKGVVSTTGEIAAEGVIAYYKSLMNAGLEESLVHALVYERAKAESNAYKAITDSLSNKNTPK